MKVTWWNFEQLCDVCSKGNYRGDMLQQDDADIPVRHAHRPAEKYRRMQLDHMLQLERCHYPWVRHYVGDDLFHHEGDCPAPPVKRFINVTGVNVRTEVAYVVKLAKKRMQTRAFDRQAPLSRFVLDNNAELVPDTALAQTHTISGGVISEEPGETTSGDGTVPFSSLVYPARWKENLDYKEVRIEGVNHRDMLSNRQLHQAIYDALTVERSPQDGALSELCVAVEVSDAEVLPTSGDNDSVSLQCPYDETLLWGYDVVQVVQRHDCVSALQLFFC